MICSFRAEFSSDFTQLKALIKESGIRLIRFTELFEENIETVVEMEIDTDMETLEDLIRKIPNHHVMLQTILPVPLKDNNCERDYDKR